MDLYNRKIIGWSLSKSMHASHSVDALNDALKNTSGSPKNIVIHSDQGIQYSSSSFRDIIKLLSMKQSMSRKGKCYDNAFVESFFSTFKREIAINKFASFEQAKTKIFEYINWYNNKRNSFCFGIYNTKAL